jgi:hypothetical protein
MRQTPPRQSVLAECLPDSCYPAGPCETQLAIRTVQFALSSLRVIGQECSVRRTNLILRFFDGAEGSGS